MLRIGQIGYANCTPIFHLLKEQFPCNDYEFIAGVPSELNGMLSSGSIDLCPSSSIEYALHANQYLILPHLSISCTGAVASVLLFSKIPIEELHGKTIMLSSESATSVNLLKVLMIQYYGCSCKYVVTHQSLRESLANNTALLMIGDAALQASFIEQDFHIYDLGEIWYRWTGLPFVFALWLCRREMSENLQLKILAQQLIDAKERAPSHYEQIAKEAPERAWMGYDRLLSYWRYNISYQLDDSTLSGLVTFFEKCHVAGLISCVPSLQFIGL